MSSGPTRRDRTARCVCPPTVLVSLDLERFIIIYQPPLSENPLQSPQVVNQLAGAVVFARDHVCLFPECDPENFEVNHYYSFDLFTVHGASSFIYE